MNTFDQQTEARGRLGRKFRTGYRNMITHYECMSGVALLAQYPGDPNEPTVEPGDLLDALTQVAPAREHVDYDETRLIEAALKSGVTWEQIGVALGYKPATAAGWAKRRAKALRIDVEAVNR